MSINPLSHPFAVIPETPESGSSHKRQRTTQNQVTSTAAAVFDDLATKPFSLQQSAPLAIATPKNLSPIAQAISNSQWSEVPALLETDLLFSANEEVPFNGHMYSLLMAAAAFHQWSLVSLMLSKDLRANINAAPATGQLQGITPLWLAVFEKKWDLAEKMLNSKCTADIYTAPVEGPFKGKPVWRLVVEPKKWDLAANLLYSHFEKKVDNNPPEYGFSSLTYNLTELLFNNIFKCSDEIKLILINYLLLENVPHTGTTWEYIQKAKELKSKLEKELKSPSELLIRPKKPCKVNRMPAMVHKEMCERTYAKD